MQSIAIRLAQAGLLCGLLAGAAGVTSVSANAALIDWTLQNVTFDDGGTASGSFITDSATGNVQSADIITTAGTTLPGTTYQYPGTILGQPSPFSTSSDSFYLSTGNPGYYITLTFLTALTSSGTDGIDTNQSYECDNCGSFRDVTGGSVFGTALAVPEPFSLAIMTSGLIGLALTRRGRRG